ncbi:MAG: hypothetical protein ACYCT7_03225 [bacterium]
MSEDTLKIKILSGIDNEKIDKLFSEKDSIINNKFSDKKLKLKVIKNIINLAGDLLQSLSEKISEADKKEIQQFKFESEYLCELIRELEELKEKIEDKDDDNGGAAKLRLAIDSYIDSIKLYEEKKLEKIDNRAEIADILLKASEVCKLADKTIETVDEINTLCDILKAVTKLVSLIHPMLLQMQVQGVKFELGIHKEFNDIVAEIVKEGMNKEDTIKKNIVGPHIKL